MYDDQSLFMKFEKEQDEMVRFSYFIFRTKGSMNQGFLMHLDTNSSTFHRTLLGQPPKCVQWYP